LARRIQGAVTSDFVHTYSLPLRPMLIEKRNGIVQRYYVHTPGGELLYHVDVTGAPTVRFHHYDHLGTTLFLTDAAGAVSDAYAYTAYGRLVRHNGTSVQPFTFLGAHGIRAEAGTDLFHMRARWYDSCTARFVSFDPKWLEMMRDPLQINPYQYVRGSPVMRTDVTGEGGWANDLWKYSEGNWNQETPITTPPVAPWRTPEAWIKTFKPPPKPYETAFAQYFRNRGWAQLPGFVPVTDEPVVSGQTGYKVENLLNPPSPLSEISKPQETAGTRESRPAQIDPYPWKDFLLFYCAAVDHSKEVVTQLLAQFSDEEIAAMLEYVKERKYDADHGDPSADWDVSLIGPRLREETARRKGAGQ